MSATDIRYGRRGGRWASRGVGQRLAELDELRARCQAEGTWPEPVDEARLFHPETIAKARAHARGCGGRHPEGEACPAEVDPDDLEAIWQGRARMAEVRARTTGQLDAIDREALARGDSGGRR